MNVAQHEAKSRNDAGGLETAAVRKMQKPMLQATGYS